VGGGWRGGGGGRGGTSTIVYDYINSHIIILDMLSDLPSGELNSIGASSS